MNETILLFLTNGITAIFGWFVGKRKASADTDNQVLKNLELSISVYGLIIQDLKKEIESLNLKIQELEKKIDELHQENKKLKSQVNL